MRPPVPRPHDPPVHRAVPALVGLLAVGGVLASAGPAAADGALAPGDTRTIELAVPDTWSAALQVDVTVGTLDQQENACLDPEREAGDDCRSEVGELAGQLTATVALGVEEDDRCTPLRVEDGSSLAPEGELDLLGRTTARLTAETAGVDCLFLELTFVDDDGVNNLAQSDTLSFPLALVARDLVASDTGVGEEQTGPEGATGSDGGSGSVPASGPPSGELAGGIGDADADVDGAGGLGTDGSPGVAAGAGDGVAVEPPAAPAGPVLDRFDAQVSVGDGGVAVQTQAATGAVQGLVLAWASLLLGAVALGWTAFVLVKRRRRKEAGA